MGHPHGAAVAAGIYRHEQLVRCFRVGFVGDAHGKLQVAVLPDCRSASVEYLIVVSQIAQFAERPLAEDLRRQLEHGTRLRGAEIAVVHVEAFAFGAVDLVDVDAVMPGFDRMRQDLGGGRVGSGLDVLLCGASDGQQHGGNEKAGFHIKNHKINFNMHRKHLIDIAFAIVVLVVATMKNRQ